MRCPRCGAVCERSTSYLETPSEFWWNCTRCNTYINTYTPQPHQAAVHKDPHLYIGNFGGYGTGKTLTSREEVLKHIFLTPNANILISANIATQYEQTIKRELESDIPKEFVKYVSVQKSYMDLINGARIIYRPLYDADTLRSLNLSMFVIVEASEVNPDVFQQLKTRTRNLSASVQEVDDEGKPLYRTQDNGTKVPVIRAEWRRGIIESNPDSGWIRTDVVNASSQITKHGRVTDSLEIPDNLKDPNISTHVASTDVNAYLPPNFIQELCANKPSWWVNRYIFSSFNYAEGLVYPMALACFVEDFAIPSTWKRVIAADYGLSDDFVYLFGAIDETKGIVYIYKEVRVNNRNIEELSKMFFDNTKDIPMGGLYCTPLLDPKSGAKRDYNKKSLFDHFLDYGISFAPGFVNVNARVFRTNTYMESGRLKIFNSCQGLRAELQDYKFPEKKLGMVQKGADKPIDKNNHAINPLEWICMALPANPKELMYGSFDEYGRSLEGRDKQQEAMIPWQLSDDTQIEGGNSDWDF